MLLLIELDGRWGWDGVGVNPPPSAPTPNTLSLSSTHSEGGIYFTGLLASLWGADRKCLLPERKSLKLREMIKQANTAGSADLWGGGRGGGRGGFVMRRSASGNRAM